MGSLHVVSDVFREASVSGKLVSYRQVRLKTDKWVYPQFALTGPTGRPEIILMPMWEYDEVTSTIVGETGPSDLTERMVALIEACRSHGYTTWTAEMITTTPGVEQYFHFIVDEARGTRHAMGLIPFSEKARYFFLEGTDIRL